MKKVCCIVLGGVALACGGGVTPAGSAPCALGADPCAFLAAHDAVRDGATPAPSPPLPSMSWSSSAVASASAWARKCIWDHDPALGTLGLGQNLYASTGPATPGTAVASWASEAVDYDLASNTCRASKVCGHYTQLVWRSSIGLGCAIERCTTGSPFPGADATWWNVVCDYAPPGNFVGERPY
ncbi:MAG TPA: CAP domain-containing protein [Anaeromyxobacteraceae bacterium]|nr:CAP domain-containing protein [Anaeromyxobacteraceae bacterium]